MFFFLGVMVGSFLYQVSTRGGWGTSQCDYCKEPLPWWCLIPLVSYLFLRGRCHQCHHKIAIDYCLVELLFGILFMLSGYYLCGVQLQKYLFCLMILFLCSIHDINTYEIRLRDLSIGILGAFYFNGFSNIKLVLIVFVSFLVFRFLFLIVYEQEGLGFGDVLVYGWMAMMFDPVFILTNIVYASIIGIGYMSIKKTTKMPFVPMIFVAYMLQLLPFL